MAARVLCKSCWVVLESHHNHDFQRCECENGTFVDGGGEYYTRYGGKDLDKVLLLAENGKY